MKAYNKNEGTHLLTLLYPILKKEKKLKHNKNTVS